MTYRFTGHRGDISLTTGAEILNQGDHVDLTEEQAAELIANDFPIERVIPEEVTTNNVEL